MSDSIERIKKRWRGVYAVDGIGKVGPNELPPDIAALIDVAEAAQDWKRVHTKLNSAHVRAIVDANLAAALRSLDEPQP